MGHEGGSDPLRVSCNIVDVLVLVNTVLTCAKFIGIHLLITQAGAQDLIFTRELADKI